ncbi:hypothetical protein WJX74_004569 [Apatococcus lobatus]|uniref:rRNA-processing protein EFG1 n=1 Tax=Apatococcus lobatus TaxID=904363 RepID=A0AAW1QIC8_9CHLO
MPGFKGKPGAGSGRPPGKAVLKGKVAKKKAAKPRSAKAQVRDLTRLLQKGTLPIKATKELTARLETLTKEHEKRQLAAREKQMSQRYHKIKFFERRKLERRIGVLRRQLTAATRAPTAKNADVSALQRHLRQTQEDLQYVLFFPPAEKYVSVVKDPGELEGEAREKLESERKRLRGLAFARRAEQAMVNEADEGAGLLGPQQDPLDHHPTQGAGEEQDDFFLQDSDGDAPDSPSAPIVPANSISAAKRPHLTDADALQSSAAATDLIAGNASAPLLPGSSKPTAKRPDSAYCSTSPRVSRVEPDAAEPDGPIVKRLRPHPSAAPSSRNATSSAGIQKPQPLLASKATSPLGAASHGQPVSSSEDLQMTGASDGSFASGSDAKNHVPHLTGSQPHEQMLTSGVVPSFDLDQTYLSGEQPQALLEPVDTQPDKQRSKSRKRLLENIFDDSSASEVDAGTLAGDGNGSQLQSQLNHQQKKTKGRSKAVHPSPAVGGGIQDGGKHLKPGVSQQGEHLQGTHMPTHRLGQNGDPASARSGPAAANLVNIADGKPAISRQAISRQQHVQPAGQHPSEGSQARLARLQALAAAIQRKHQPQQEHHPEAHSRPPSHAAGHPFGMRGNLPGVGKNPGAGHAQFQQGGPPSGLEQPCDEHGKVAKAKGVLQRSDQRAGSSAGRAGVSPKGGAASGREPGGKPHLLAQQTYLAKHKQAQGLKRPHNALKPALILKSLNHKAGSSGAKAGKEGVVVAKADAGTVDGAAKGRTRAEGGRKRRKKK